MHGVPLLQWLRQWGRETERPPYRDPVLHFHALRLIALRGGDRSRDEDTLKTDNEGDMLMRRACASTLSPRSFFAAGVQLAAHTQPALRTGLMAPAWRLLPCFPDSNFDLNTRRHTHPNALHHMRSPKKSPFAWPRTRHARALTAPRST